MVRFAKRVVLYCFMVMLYSSLFFLSGCDQQKQPEAPPIVANKFQTYRIGLLPEQNLFEQKKRYEPLLNYLSKQLGVTLQAVVLPRYGDVIEDFRQANLDGAFFGSLTGAIACSTLGVEPLARPQYLNGASSFYGMVFVKKGLNIQSATDLRHKRMAFVDPVTSTGYLLPLAYFNSLGIKDYRNWFDETYFSGTHEDTIYDVLNGLADIGAAKNTVFYRLAEKDKRIIEELEVVATSPETPSSGLAMLKDIPDELKQGLREKLLTMHLTAAGRKILAGLKIERFINSSVEDYRPAVDYARSLGIDI